MAPRGNRNKGKQRNSKHKLRKGPNKRKKSINLHELQSQGREKAAKRKKYDHSNDSNLKIKQNKVEVVQQEFEDSSSSEDDNMKKLLGTFDNGGINRKTVAIDSSSEEHSSEEDSNTGSDVQDDEDALEVNIDSASSIEDEGEKSQIGTELQVEEDKEAQSEGNANRNDVEIEDGEVDVEIQKEDENVQEIRDPFVRHLFYELSDSLLTSVQSIPITVSNIFDDWPLLGRLKVQIPKCENETAEASTFSIAERKMFAPSGTTPSRIKVNDNDNLSSFYIKTQIVGNIPNANKCRENISCPLTLLQAEIFSIINNYQDFYYPCRTFENGEEIRFVYVLHMVNHILKTRTKVLHHNARLTKKEDVPEEFRDQGLVRPKILVVVPFRDSAYRIISMLIDILIPEDKGNVMNKSRFMEEFTGHEIVMPKKNPKPEDYEKLFSGNTGDEFKIGISVTKKSLKLFSEFYSSDIIVASPLGLRTIIGADGETQRDYDFLASMELLILDQTEIFLMQNWDHLLHTLNHLHLQPKESHGTDFSRVRTWSLNGWAKYYRQTLIFSSMVLPEINAIFNKKCFNYAGKVNAVQTISSGSICQVFVQLPHVFHKFNVDDVSQLPESRLAFFIGKVLPQQKETLMKQTVIFVSNYFDFVTLRNYFKKEDISFVQICEYSKEGKVARARDIFFHGDAHFLLYTERYHFFNRIRMKGIRHLVFYQPPNFPHFYYEMCNLMQEGNMNKKVGSMSNMTVTVLYSKYDIHQLAALVGTERASRMIQSDRNVHMLVTDGK